MKTRVRLSPLTLSDETEFLSAVKRSSKLHRSWVSPPKTPATFRSKVSKMHGPTDYAFSIKRRDTNVLVGYVEITNIVRGSFLSAYLGYYAFASHERQGYMKEGLVQAVHYAFSKLKLHRLEANVQPTNRASAALVRSCGFTREGYSKRYLKIRGRWRDHERWAIIAR